METAGSATAAHSVCSADCKWTQWQSNASAPERNDGVFHCCSRRKVRHRCRQAVVRAVMMPFFAGAGLNVANRKLSGTGFDIFLRSVINRPQIARGNLREFEPDEKFLDKRTTFARSYRRQLVSNADFWRSLRPSALWVSRNAILLKKDSKY